MQTTRLGKTGLTVTRSAFGALPIQRLSVEEAAALLRRAFDAGMTFFDTARAYSDSEHKIAVGLGDVRECVVIATKTMSSTVEGVARDLETSLKTLQTDYIDIYQLHNPARIPLADDPVYAYLLSAKAAGKIRHIGVTCHKLTNAQEALVSGLYETIQYPLSALSTEAELKFARASGEKDVGVIAMKALCGGLLTSAAPSMAVLRPYAHVVPIWGFQAEHELQEVIELEKAPPALDDAMRARIEADRAALGGEFCRGCGYCMPCAVDIPISMAARMSLLLRRAPYKSFLTPEWQANMKRIDDCADCGLCMSRCPYSLEIPRLLRSMAEDYWQFAAEHTL